MIYRLGRRITVDRESLRGVAAFDTFEDRWALTRARNKLSMVRKTRHLKTRTVLAETNRGVLLDIVVFVTNLGLMGLMTNYFVDVIRRAGEDDPKAQLILLMCALAMFVLPAAGAVLKRWHFHKRRKATAQKQEDKEKIESNAGAWLFNPMNPESKAAQGCSNLGCLFNALFQFVLAIFLLAVVMSLLQALVFGKSADQAKVFVPLVVLSLVMCVVQTVLIYRYFTPPKNPPKRTFWRDSKSELLGDLCIFVNMIFFQVFWNIVIRDFPSMRVTSFSNLAGNVFFFSFLALLVYFPPRIFYLAEDFNRPATWITMFLANAPTIVRALFGTGQSAAW